MYTIGYELFLPVMDTFVLFFQAFNFRPQKQHGVVGAASRLRRCSCSLFYRPVYHACRLWPFLLAERFYRHSKSAGSCPGCRLRSVDRVSAVSFRHGYWRIYVLMAYSVSFLQFGSGRIFAVFACYVCSCPPALDDPDPGHIFFHRLYYKIPPLVYYYSLNPCNRGPAPNRVIGMVGVLFPADPCWMPVPLCKRYTRVSTADCWVGNGE